MGWSFEEIKADWLGAGSPMAPDALVTAFDRAEKLLGRNWIEDSRRSQIGGGISRGLLPTLRVASMGQQLAALDGVIGPIDKLIERIRQGERSAEAELAAIFLLRSRNPIAIVEIYPKVGDGEADFRTRLPDSDWTYVEVAQPSESEPARVAKQVITKLTQPLQQVNTPFSLEVYLKREPAEQELTPVSDRIEALCRKRDTRQEELPAGLGFLILNISAPGDVVRLQLPGDDGPRIGVIAIAGDGGKPNRKISVSMPFADNRAEAFLTTEARQLPKDSPGMIALELSGASGGLKTWEPLLLRRLQPIQHTRVSAICLFEDAVVTFHAAEQAFLQTKLILNPYAKYSLPEWIQSVVVKSGEDFDRIVQPTLVKGQTEAHGDGG